MRGGGGGGTRRRLGDGASAPGATCATRDGGGGGTDRGALGGAGGDGGDGGAGITDDQRRRKLSAEPAGRRAPSKRAAEPGSCWVASLRGGLGSALRRWKVRFAFALNRRSIGASRESYQYCQIGSKGLVCVRLRHLGRGSFHRCKALFCSLGLRREVARPFLLRDSCSDPGFAPERFGDARSLPQRSPRRI